MRRLLGLLLALVAPAQAVIHHDGFEARMPITEWRQILGPADGTASATVLVPHNDAAAINDTVYSHVFDNGGIIPDFPTTPVGKNSIVGVEFRIKARASHPGVCVTEIEWAGFYAQTGGSGFYLYSQASQNVSAPDFEIGGEPDLSLGSYVDVGGYASLIPRETIETDGDVSQSMNDSQFWLSDDLEAPGEPLNPYILHNQNWVVRFRSLDGYDATLLIDSIHVRLHYNDASTIELDGSGSMAVTLQKAMPINAALSGAGTIAATMNAHRVIAASMEGSGKVSPVLTRDVSGTIYRYLMPELSGSGTMAVTPLIRYAPIPAAMSGGGTMSATLQRGHGIKASAPVAMSAVGTLAHDLAAQRPISSAMNGAGVLAASMVARRPIPVSLSGSVAMTASLGANRPVVAAMAGSGALAATIQRILGSQPVGASMAGSGSMAVDLIAHRPVAAAMTGAGTVNADGLTINTRLVAPEGRSFYAADDAMAFIAPDDFLTFEAQE